MNLQIDIQTAWFKSSDLNSDRSISSIQHVLFTVRSLAARFDRVRYLTSDAALPLLQLDRLSRCRFPRAVSLLCESCFTLYITAASGPLFADRWSHSPLQLSLGLKGAQWASRRARTFNLRLDNRPRFSWALANSFDKSKSTLLCYNRTSRNIIAAISWNCCFGFNWIPVHFVWKTKSYQK